MSYFGAELAVPTDLQRQQMENDAFVARTLAANNVRTLAMVLGGGLLAYLLWSRK